MTTVRAGRPLGRKETGFALDPNLFIPEPSSETAVRALRLLPVLAIVGTLLLGAGVWVAYTGPTGMASHSAATSAPTFAAHPAVVPAVAANNLIVAGAAPEMASISWNASNDTFLSSYQVNFSFNGSSGSWIPYVNITNLSITQIGYTDVPGSLIYWEVTTWDCFITCVPSGVTNVVPVFQPDNATSGGFWINDTAVLFGWTNPAFYGGNISFSEYALWESVNGSGYALNQVIVNPFVTEVVISNLTPDTNYSFYVGTWDFLSDPIFGGFYVSNSTVTNFTTPSTLSAGASVNRSTTDVGQPLSFACAGAGGFSPYSYAWAFGDGNLGSGATTSYTYTTTGTMVATCTATDFVLSSANAGGLSIVVSADPTAAAPTASVASVDVGQSVTFASVTTPGSGGLTYAWSGLPAGCSGTTDPLTCTPTAAGTSSVVLQVMDSNGFVAASTGLSFTVYADPTVNLPTASGSSVLEGKSVTFNVSTTPGSGALTYSWAGLPAGCTSADAASITCTPTATGTFSIVVTVTDSNGGSATSTPLSFKVDPSFLGFPAVEGYAIVGGGLAALIVVIAAVALLMRRRRKGGQAGPTPPAGATTQQPITPGNPPESPPNPPA